MWILKKSENCRICKKNLEKQNKQTPCFVKTVSSYTAHYYTKNEEKDIFICNNYNKNQNNLLINTLTNIILQALTNRNVNGNIDYNAVISFLRFYFIEQEEVEFIFEIVKSLDQNLKKEVK